MSVNIDLIDVYFLDTFGLIGSYLLRSNGENALIETGPGSCREALEKGLSAHGLTPQDIHKIMVTHIHLDHAGGVGWWAQHGAKVFVHHVGAPHLEDPSRLWASASRVWGGEEMMNRLWGEMRPVPSSQIIPLHDQDEIILGEAKIIAHDTPGHASHHMAYQLENVCFTGDVAGVHLRHSNYIRMPSPPPEFHFERWKKSLATLQALCLEKVYLTHFGVVDDPQNYLKRAEGELHQQIDLIRPQWEAGQSIEKMSQSLIEWAKRRADEEDVSDDVFGLYEDVVASAAMVEGIERYFRKHSA